MGIYKFKIYYGGQQVQDNIPNELSNLIKNPTFGDISGKEGKRITLKETINHSKKLESLKTIDKIEEYLEKNNITLRGFEKYVKEAAVDSKNIDSEQKNQDDRIPNEVLDFINKKIIFIKNVSKEENNWQVKKLESLKTLNEIYQLDQNNNKTFKQIKDYLEKYIKNQKNSLNKKKLKEIDEKIPQHILKNKEKISKLKEYVNDKIHKIDKNSNFTKKIISKENKINISNYLFHKRYSFYEVKWFHYFKNDFYDKEMYLNFNFYKYINDIFEKEIDNYSNDRNIKKINENNYFFLYELITKFYNIKDFNLDLITFFFTNDDINNIISLLFTKKLKNLLEIKVEDKILHLKMFYYIYNDLRFKITSEIFKSIIRLIKSINISNFLNINMLYQESINEMKEHENDLEEAKPENNLEEAKPENDFSKIDLNIADNYFKVNNYRKLLNLYHNNKDIIDKNDINFMKEYFIDLFKNQANNDNFIIYIKSNNKQNTNFKFELYLLYSILFLLGLLTDEETKEIESLINNQIKMISKEYYEFHISSNDEKQIISLLNKSRKNFISEYHDNYNIIPFDFYLPKENTLIELDGRYHFILTINEYGVLENKYKYKDIIKNELAKKLKYKLIRFTSMYNAENIGNLYFYDFKGKFVETSPKNINIYLGEISNTNIIEDKEKDFLDNFKIKNKLYHNDFQFEEESFKKILYKT